MSDEIVALPLVFLLLGLFQLKHYVADYVLQNRYMLGKFDAGWTFALPLATHVAVHAALTFIICVAFEPSMWWLSLVDGISHFFIDRVKASPRMLGRFDRTQAPYWWTLGADQMLHHLVHYCLIYRLLVSPF